MAEHTSFPEDTSSFGKQADRGPLPPLMGEIPPSPSPKTDTPAKPSSESPESVQGAPSADTRKSAIRTMKADVERLFKTAPPSIAQMIGKPGPMSPIAKKHIITASLYVALGILFFVAGGTLYYFWDSLIPSPTVTEIKKAVPPAPFFAIESSRTVQVTQSDRQQFIKLMNDATKEFERDGTVKRILIKYVDTPDERFATMSDFLNVYHITPPEKFLQRLIPGLMVFVYTSSGTRLGLAVRTSDPARTMRDMLDWEPSMLFDFKPLFFSQQLAPVTTAFEDRTYRNIDWRYLKLSSDTDIGIGYTVFPAGNILVITTSRAAMETVISRLFDAR